MTDLERIKKDVVEMDSRANVCWYDTKVLTKAARLILEELTADRKTDSDSEIPNNCEHITEDGVTCAKYPACDDCLDNPLNKVKGSERLVKGSEQRVVDRKTEPTSSKMEQVEDETQTETEIAKAIVHKMIDDAVIAEDAYPDLRQKMHDAVDEYEPQTDCAWK